jgi:phosphomannomutase
MALSEFLSKVDGVIKRDDIRGVYGENIDSEFAYDLGLALAETFLGCTAVDPVNVVVGHDMRLSGPVLAESLCAGLDDGGCRSVRMGRAGTELVGFLPARYSDVIDGGIIITASHNPRDNNGFKFFGRGGRPLPMAAEEAPPCPEDPVRRMALSIKKRQVPARLSWDDFAPDYIRTVVERAGCDFEAALSGAPSPLRVAVEAGNGMGARILREFAAAADGFEWRWAHDVPDGAFPVIIPNPLEADYQAMLRELVLATESHVGVCFDGDADRVAMCDEQGRMLSPPQLTALVGRRLRRKLGSDVRIAFNLASSWVVADTLGDRSRVLGGEGAVMTPVGYGKIKPIMYGDPQIALGAEHSGHYMFREFWCADSGMMAALLMLELVAELHAEGKPLSSVLEQMRERYCESGEINFQLPPERPGDEEIAAAVGRFSDQIERLYVVSNDRCRQVDAYPPQGMELSVSDVRAECEDWWFCMRKSGTEAGAGDLLRLYVEAVGDRALMERKRDALVEMVGPGLRV